MLLKAAILPLISIGCLKKFKELLWAIIFVEVMNPLIFDARDNSF